MATMTTEIPQNSVPIVIPEKIKEGFFGNLTEEQECLLRTFWVELFDILNSDADNAAILGVTSKSNNNGDEDSDHQSVASSTKTSKGVGKSLSQTLRRMNPRPNVDKPPAGVDDITQGVGNISVQSGEKGAESSGNGSCSTKEHNVKSPEQNNAAEKYGQKGPVAEAMSKYPKEKLKETFWGLVKFDHPDVIVLRFLRARKWDIEKAITMLFATMKWRIEMGVEEIIEKGEEGFQDDDGFMKQLTKGKSFLYGTDKEGRPVTYINAALHESKDQSITALEKYTVYQMETARLMLKSPVETGCLIFDMTGFSLKNLDYDSVNFLVRCFEAYYPESLGLCIINSAPWIFWGVWKCISPLLDPVVRSKIVFTKDKLELQQYLPVEHIVPWLSGTANFEYKYVPVKPGENEKHRDTEGKAAAKAKREALEKEFEKLTMQWCHEMAAKLAAERAMAEGAIAGSEKIVDMAKHLEEESEREIEDVFSKRNKNITELREAQWELEKYTRATTLYHRLGIVRDNGGVVWNYGNGVVETRDV